MPPGHDHRHAGSVFQRAGATGVFEEARLRGGAGERRGGADAAGQSGRIHALRQRREHPVSQLRRRKAAPCRVCRLRPGNGRGDGGAGCFRRRHAHLRTHWRGRTGQGQPRPSALLYQRARGALSAAFKGAGAGVPQSRDHRHVPHVRAESGDTAHGRGCERPSQQAGGALPGRRDDARRLRAPAGAGLRRGTRVAD